MSHTSEWLRSAFGQLPALTGDSIWDKRRSELRDMVQTQDPASFLAWSTIVGTMFVGNAPYIDSELAALPRHYLEAIQDPGIGAPELHSSGSSGNLIHQAYHLSQWERVTGQPVSNLGCIVEFGGGYGAMALIALRLGFQGSYQIIDLPEFSLLQQYYLSHALPGNCQIVWDDQATECDLLIACHSLSEVSLPVRNKVLQQIDADSYLFVYHCEHDRIDNLGYFADFADSMPNYRWADWVTEHLPNQRYSVGQGSFDGTR